MFYGSYIVTFIIQVLWDVFLFSIGWFLDIDYKYIVDVVLELYEMFLPSFIMNLIKWWYSFAYLDWIDEKAESWNLWLYTWYDSYFGFIHTFDRNRQTHYPFISDLFASYHLG